MSSYFAVYVINAVVVFSAQGEQEPRHISRSSHVSVEPDGSVTLKHKSLVRKVARTAEDAPFVTIKADGQTRVTHDGASPQDEPEMQYATEKSEASVKSFHLHALDQPAALAETRLDKTLSAKILSGARRRTSDPRRRSTSDPRRRSTSDPRRRSTSDPRRRRTSGTSKTLEDVGNPPGRDLQECQGDCDSDQDCADGLRCFQRDRQDSVPGCSGSGTWEFDYCVPSSSPPGPTTPPCTGSQCKSLEVMSYNTEYLNYQSRINGYAKQIRDVGPDIVGLQECQDRDGLARRAGYTALKRTGGQNYIVYNPSKVKLVSDGWMSIPRDNHAPRAITWGQFELGGQKIWFFNTHLPHNHRDAASKKTHAKIAGMFLDKRKELGADSKPTIVVGDMNPFASNNNRVSGGGFESNLRANGFTKAYTARGNPGHGGLDKILYSTAHWSHRNCKDAGTGGSDHPSITCDLVLK